MSEKLTCSECRNKILQSDSIMCESCLADVELDACDVEHELDNLRKENEELKVKDTGLAARMAYEAYESEYGITKYNCLEAMEKILDELYPPRSEDSE